MCLPPSTFSGASICQGSYCDNGSPGCQLKFHTGAITKMFTAGTGDVLGNVTVSGSVTSMEGSIRVHYVVPGTCSLSVTVPDGSAVALSASAKIVRQGADAGIDGGSSFLVMQRTAATIDISHMNLVGSSGVCAVAGFFDGFLTTLLAPTANQVFREALDANANRLTCLDCDPACDEKLSCVAH